MKIYPTNNDIGGRRESRTKKTLQLISLVSGQCELISLVSGRRKQVHKNGKALLDGRGAVGWSADQPAEESKELLTMCFRAAPAALSPQKPLGPPGKQFILGGV